MTAGIPAYSMHKNAASRGVFSRNKINVALACVALLIGACGSTEKDRTRLQKLNAELCTLEHTPLSSIQGSQFVSPLIGSEQEVLAVVTHVVPTKGLFIEQPLADGDSATSDALWIEDARVADKFVAGDQVLLRGTVAELGREPHSLTALTAISGFVRCDENQPLPQHETGMPLDLEQREALEGMRVQMQQNLVVTNVRDALTRNQFTLSLGGRLVAPTEHSPPGEEAGRIDQRNRDTQVTLQWTEFADASLLDATPADVLVNDGIFQFSGVLTDTNWQYAVITESLGWLPAVRKLPTPVARQGNLRIASLNVLNYFNGDGAGGGFPTDRGAKTLAEFEQQRSRLVSAVVAMDPDVLALMELENDGFGPRSAIQDLADALNYAMPAAGWRIAKPQKERLGDGHIAVGIMFRSSSIRALGPASTLDSGIFARRSRRPVAQRFEHKATGKSFMAVVNHFKSKSSCPEDGPDSNQEDGQACWNPARIASATQLDEWLNSLRNILGEQRIVVLGDFNAMRMEDPIQIMLKQGWIEQVAKFNHQPQHTFNFRGVAGTLDYIFASDTMSAASVDSRVWPINADYPIGGVDGGPLYLRSSDHDPVIADFNLE